MQAPMKKAIKLLIICGIFLIPGLSSAQGILFNLRHWSAPDNTRIVLDVSDETDFNVISYDGKVTVELFNTVIGANLQSEINLIRSGVKNITILDHKKDAVRIDVTLLEGSAANVFKLKRVEDKPERLVIDVTNYEVERQLERAREEIKSTKKGLVIVIDPGHGGEDPGAIGKSGTREKDVVLSISKKLQQQINALDGYQAFLTRNADYYVPFKKRLKIARDYGADLFISIHADAAKNRKAAGSSVYSLSSGGALTEAARILARKENLADIIGGTINGYEIINDSSPIILNMFQNNTINISKSFGSLVLTKLSGLSSLKFSQVQEAPFIVLKLPEIPAVLIETLYISNPKEEKLLRNKKFQEAMARQISQAIHEFRPLQQRLASDGGEKQLPPPIERNLQQTDISLVHQEKPQLYEDALEDVFKNSPPAADASARTKKEVAQLSRQELSNKGKYGLAAKPLSTSPKVYLRKDTKSKTAKVAIAKHNNTKNAKSKKARVAIYQVKKGDTLEKIALRHNTTVRELVLLNSLNKKEGLAARNKVIVPLAVKGKAI